MSKSVTCYSSKEMVCDHCCVYDIDSDSYPCGSYFDCNPIAYFYATLAICIVIITIIVSICCCVRKCRSRLLRAPAYNYEPPSMISEPSEPAVYAVVHLR